MKQLHKIVLLFLLFSLLPLTIPHPTPTFASNCGVTSVGFAPLNDLGMGSYLGSQGGLYPNGSNQKPAAHAQVGLDIAQNIQPLNGTGQVDEANGRSVIPSPNCFD